jgi:hypothetical protein
MMESTTTLKAGEQTFALHADLLSAIPKTDGHIGMENAHKIEFDRLNLSKTKILFIAHQLKLD